MISLVQTLEGTSCGMEERVARRHVCARGMRTRRKFQLRRSDHLSLRFQDDPTGHLASGCIDPCGEHGRLGAARGASGVTGLWWAEANHKGVLLSRIDEVLAGLGPLTRGGAQGQDQAYDDSVDD